MKQPSSMVFELTSVSILRLGLLILKGVAGTKCRYIDRKEDLLCFFTREQKSRAPGDRNKAAVQWTGLRNVLCRETGG